MGPWTCIEREIFENNSVYKRKEIILDEVFPVSNVKIASAELKVKKSREEAFGRPYSIEKTCNFIIFYLKRVFNTLVLIV